MPGLANCLASALAPKKLAPWVLERGPIPS